MRPLHILPLSLPMGLVLALAACASSGSDASAGTPPRPEPPGIPRAPDPECRADAAQRFVGQTATDAVVQAALDASRATQVRVLGPNDAATADFRSDRLNVFHDADRRIVRIACG